MMLPNDMQDFIDCATASLDDKWGFAVYRCTYESEEDFTTLMEILTERVRESLEIHNIPQWMESFEWITFSDPAKFDGLSRNDVRDHYNRWVVPVTEEDQQNLNLPRWKLCLYVGADVINSVVRRAPRPPDHDWRSIGYVDVINLQWSPDGRYALQLGETVTEYVAERMTELDEKEKLCIATGYPEIEGSALWDVGWCRFRADRLPGLYNLLLGGLYWWDIMYDRPPEVCDSDPIPDEIKRKRREARESAGLD